MPAVHKSMKCHKVCQNNFELVTSRIPLLFEYVVLDLRQEFKKKSQLAIGFNLSLFFLEQENIQ